MSKYYNNFLMHFGILGMKWGIRRYQNENGTLTEEGKKRYRTYKDDKTGTSDEQIISETKSAELRAEASIYKNASNAINDTAKLIPNGRRRDSSKYDSLSDEELNKRVNRLKKENEYASLNGDSLYIKSGADKTREILQTTGAVVGILGTTALIAGTVNDIVRGNPRKTSKN